MGAISHIRAAIRGQQQIQIDKRIRMALSGVQVVIGFLLLLGDNINWNGLVGPKTGGTIVMAIGLFKVFYGSLAPNASRSTVPTGTSVVTQVTPEGHTQPQV